MISFTNPQLATGILAITVVPWVIYQCLKPRPLRDFPHNPITNILGDIPELVRLIKNEHICVLDYLELLVKRHGPVVQMCMGNKVTLLIADQDEIERLYVRGKSVDTSQDLISAFQPIIPTGQNALISNDMWKRHRRIMGPSMHRRYLSRMAHHFSASANQLVELWSLKLNLADGKSFEAASDIKLATMDSISSFITGQSFGCLARALASTVKSTSTEPAVAEFSGCELPPISHAVETVIASVGFAFQLPFTSLLFPIYIFFSRKWRRDYNLIRTHLWNCVEEAKKREDTLTQSGDLLTDADCVIDMLIQQEAREGSEPFSKQEMLDELTVFILAGQETTTAALAWLVKFMALDLDIQRRLHEEVCEVFGTSLTDTSSITLEILDDSEKTPVLEAVLAETLRCALVGSGSKRQLVEDEIIMGRHAPKGTDILALNGLLGLSEVAWGPEAKRWRPTRWLRPDGTFNRNAGPSGNPFGIGHRACFGQRLAVMQLKIFIVTLSRAFIFRSVAPAVDEKPV
ncbi:cytochrome P450 family protein [Ceratobasidium sp. AG-Ba]|nr:cytochrome P450 family protein [Ceratobasidium sp. AG-Ba]